MRDDFLARNEVADGPPSHIDAVAHEADELLYRRLLAQDDAI
jgi:hypothetical protein